MVTDRYVSFDWAMKRLLRNKANFGVLEGLLSVLFNEEVEIQDILESEGNKNDENDKFNRVDLKVRNSKGEIIIVEIQNSRETYFLHRLLYGTSKAVTEHIDEGDDYDQVKKIISISIVYFDLGKGKDYLYHGETVFTGVHTNDELVVSDKERKILPKRPQDIYPEYYIIRVNEFDKVATTPLDQWVRYLKTGVIENTDTAPGLQAARKRLRYYDLGYDDRIAYDNYIDGVRRTNDQIATAKREGDDEGHERGLKEGVEIGRKEGRKEGREEGERLNSIKTAKAMKANSLPVSMIAECTGLTEEEINEL